MNPKLVPFFSGIKSIQYKNNGGCLFFCYVFWLWLKQNNMPVETFQIVQYASPREDNEAEHNQAWIENQGEYDNPKSSYHFTWYYDGTEYDSNGLVNRANINNNATRIVLDGLNTEYLELVEKFCVSALLHGSWNMMFDRAMAVSMIQEEFDLELEHVL